MTGPNYLTVKQLANKYPAFTESSIRKLIFHAKNHSRSPQHAKTNGLEAAVIRIGRKVLIDEERWLEWLGKQKSPSN